MPSERAAHSFTENEKISPCSRIDSVKKMQKTYLENGKNDHNTQKNSRLFTYISLVWTLNEILIKAHSSAFRQGDWLFYLIKESDPLRC